MIDSIENWLCSKIKDERRNLLIVMMLELIGLPRFVVYILSYKVPYGGYAFCSYKRFRYDLKFLDWCNGVVCRFRGHLKGVVWYNPNGYEPDYTCKGCGDDLG